MYSVPALCRAATWQLRGQGSDYLTRGVLYLVGLFLE